MTAALLAGNRQFVAARDALSNFARDTRGREGQRIAYQLRRWIDSEGGVPVPPGRNDRLTGGEDPPPPLRAWLPKATASAVRHEMVRRGALRAAQRRPEDSRADTRGRLQAEYRRRGVTPTPLEVEQAVASAYGDLPDAVGEPPTDHGGVQGFFKRATSRQSMPTQLAPPVQASYGVRFKPQDPWDGVEIDPPALDWLAQVYDDAPRLDGIAVGLQAWLNGSTDGAPPSVHIGPRLVGRVPTGATHYYVAALAETAAYGELPWLVARLSRAAADRRYLLEVRRPAGPQNVEPHT